MSKKFISNIRNIRESAGLTQRDIAYELGITETTIRNWENERTGFETIVTIWKLSKILKCSLDDMVKVADE